MDEGLSTFMNSQELGEMGSEVESSVAFSLVEDALKLNEAS
jgi:hypothetical protein